MSNPYKTKYNIDYYMNLASELARAGIHVLCIKVSQETVVFTSVLTSLGCIMQLVSKRLQPRNAKSLEVHFQNNLKIQEKLKTKLIMVKTLERGYTKSARKTNIKMDCNR